MNFIRSQAALSVGCNIGMQGIMGKRLTVPFSLPRNSAKLMSAECGPDVSNPSSAAFASLEFEPRLSIELRGDEASSFASSTV